MLTRQEILQVQTFNKVGELTLATGTAAPNTQGPRSPPMNAQAPPFHFPIAPPPLDPRDPLAPSNNAQRGSVATSGGPSMSPVDSGMSNLQQQFQHFNFGPGPGPTNIPQQPWNSGGQPPSQPAPNGSPPVVAGNMNIPQGSSQGAPSSSGGMPQPPGNPNAPGASFSGPPNVQMPQPNMPQNQAPPQQPQPQPFNY